MKLITVLLLAFGTLQGSRKSELSEFRERASVIGEQADSREITTEQARRRVQLLVKELEAWAEEKDVDLELRTRTLTASGEPDSEPLSVNACSLFYDTPEDAEAADELCLINLERSEIWGTAVLFCRYLCE